MHCAASQSPEALIAAARAGQRECAGALLEHYGNYLKLLAKAQIDLQLQTRANPSDVVQETFLEAYRDFGQFQGTTEAELLAWLRRILVNNLARLVERHLLAKKRDARRDVSLEQIGASVDRSAAWLHSALACDGSSPSVGAAKRERSAILADQLARLPSQYRDVLVLRHLEGLSFDEVAARMGRTSGATRMLWMRAIDQLRRTLEKEGVL